MQLKPGDILTNSELANYFKCGTQGGMRKSNQTNSLVLISNHLKSLYDDRWIDDIFHYTGMGTKGDQSLDFMQNKTLVQSINSDISIFLFEVFEEKKYTYIGEVQLTSTPYKEIQPDSNGKDRNVWVFPLKLKNTIVVPIDNKIYKSLEEKKQKQVKSLSLDELKDRATKSRKNVGRRPVISTQYERDPLVSEYTKRKANGVCQLCNEKAPFLNSKNEPYLETHHIIWLSKGGEDTIENTVALCPNCHKKMHILNLDSDREYLLKKVNTF